MIIINVLSLFDGISCGQIALERAGIKINKYYASEIEENAIKITKKNFPDTVQLGDVTNWKAWDLPNIDLLIGGSPCQGFSFAGKQLNFEDPRSKLFFEFVNILHKAEPKYFLLENVKMKKESEDIITEYLGVNPIEINSNLVSAQNRKRLYWTNIPNVTIPKDKEIKFQSILTDGITDKEKAYCLTVHMGTIRDYFKKSQSNIVYLPNENGKYEVVNGVIKIKFPKGKEPEREFEFKTKVSDGRYDFRPINSLECERLQTLPEKYTDVEGLSENAKCKAMGNGWTVDVIAHIFKGLK